MDLTAPATLTCGQCGSRFPVTGGSPLTGCRPAYDALCGRTLTSLDSRFPHQFVVDSYWLQHPATTDKPIGALFRLVGICLTAEFGFTGREVQLAHMALSKKKPPEGWRRVDVPSVPWSRNIERVLADLEGGNFYDVLRGWSVDTWNDLPSLHDEIRTLCLTVPVIAARDVRGGTR